MVLDSGTAFWFDLGVGVFNEGIVLRLIRNSTQKDQNRLSYSNLTELIDKF